MEGESRETEGDLGWGRISRAVVREGLTQQVEFRLGLKRWKRPTPQTWGKMVQGGGRRRAAGGGTEQPLPAAGPGWRELREERKAL